MAKLEPPAGKTPLEGLEVKVGFNGKWKESLNELSGGVFLVNVAYYCFF